MNATTYTELANFIWSICNLLRGPYKRNEYRKVILPLTVLRRFDCLLAPTKARVLAEHPKIKAKPETVVRSLLEKITGRPFYNLSKLDLPKLLDDPNQLAPNLNAYINGFSKNVREIMERFAFDQQIARMAEKNLLYKVIKKFAAIDLSEGRIDNVQMGYVFEELIRIGAEQSNEEAGEHFTPREVIRLMVNLLLSPEKDLRKSHVVKTIYDPACGTGGMLSVAEQYIRELNADADPHLFGQDWNDESWAVCKSDMLIKGEDADNIVRDDSFTKDGFDRDADGKKRTFDYMLANPPFGVEWKQQQKYAAIVTTLERFAMGQDVCLLRAEAQHPRYLLYLIKSESLVQQLDSLMVGATFRRVNVGQLRTFWACWPPPAEQEAIADFLDREIAKSEAMTAKVEAAIERLQEYRTALITAAVTGKVDVRAAA